MQPGVKTFLRSPPSGPFNGKTGIRTLTGPIRSLPRPAQRNKERALEMQIAMIGLGRMGANMARRLLRGGHEVVAYNRSRESVDALAREGATPAYTLREAVQLAKGRALTEASGGITPQTAPARHSQSDHSTTSWPSVASASRVALGRRVSASSLPGA